MSKKLYLLDGHALVYRSHFAFINRPLINSQGVNTSAVQGFIRTLWGLFKKKDITHIAVSFDLKGPTFRHEMYEPYKANREAQPEDISIAIPIIKKIIEAFNVPIYSKQGFEADDVIGTIAKKAEKEGFEVYMMTPDKDYAQLVSDKVFMYKPARFGNGIDILGEKEVLEKWGIKRVDQVIDVLGLQGDKVDNIPGIPGIGPKTATKLLALYDTVEGIIEHSHELKGKQRENVENFAEQGILSKELATIKLDVDVPFKSEDCIKSDFNTKELSVIFKELELRALAKSILGETTIVVGEQGSLFGNMSASASTKQASAKPEANGDMKNINTTEHQYVFVDTEEKKADLLSKLEKSKLFCFDTETDQLDPNKAGIVGISFAIETGTAYYVPLVKDYDEAKAGLDYFKSVLENTSIAKVGQNLNYDLNVLRWYDIKVQGALKDTMIMHYLLEPDLRHNMDYLSEVYLDYTPVSIKTLIGKGKHQLSMRDIAQEKISDYACEDADITLQLYHYFQPKIQEEKLEGLYRMMEEPLISILVDIQYNGIKLDGGFLNKYSEKLGVKIIALEQEIYKQAGTPFNIASPAQVGTVLFDRLGIPYKGAKTKTGKYSTNEERLQSLAPDQPIVKDILKFRGLSKLRSTYVDALPLLINPKTGRIHSSFNQALASTGRLSSSNPNLQNIPIRTPEGQEVRKAFVPRDKNHKILAADYSQVELRLIAEMSGDENMLEAFIKGQDIHRATAARVYDVNYDDVTKDQRRNAKTVNFSIIYGAGATNLSKQLDIKRGEAKILIEEYFKSYPQLKKYMDDTVAFAREEGYVKTMLGRKRKLRDINSKNGMIRSGSERVAINSPVQGTAADMIKLAMINLKRRMDQENVQSKMILQVHDELLFDVIEGEEDLMTDMVRTEMANAMPGLKVPIIVDMEFGSNWLEAH